MATRGVHVRRDYTSGMRVKFLQAPGYVSLERLCSNVMTIIRAGRLQSVVLLTFPIFQSTLPTWAAESPALHVFQRISSFEKSRRRSNAGYC